MMASSGMGLEVREGSWNLDLDLDCAMIGAQELKQQTHMKNWIYLLHSHLLINSSLSLVTARAHKTVQVDANAFPSLKPNRIQLQHSTHTSE